MRFLSYLKYSVVAFLLVSMSPCFANEIENIAIQQTISRIDAIRETKKQQIEELFVKWQNDVSVLAEFISLLPNIREKKITKEQIIFLGKYVEIYGYYDLYLIDNKGKYFYSVKGKGESQTNLIKGELSPSGLASSIKMVIETEQPNFFDFAPYSLNNNNPSAFIAHPIILSGAIQSVVVLQIPLKEINKIMQQRDGLGQTGEAYLIGEDKLMRSDSILNLSVKSSFAKKGKGVIDTESANMAISGLTYSKLTTDYNGNEVLSSFSPIKLGDTTWGIIVEINKAEVLGDPLSRY